MAKTPEKTETTTETQDPQAQAAQAAQQRAPQQQQQVEVDDTHLISAYANFCRVTGSPEELIVDFALNPQPIGMPTKPIKIDQRIVMNYFTAKRLLAALSMSLQRHEAVFGVLETDIQKRVRAQQSS
ncbi:MAG: DUF3467 domain-containing protein [Pirellulaceae bacterium]